MDACLACGVDYIDTANYEAEDTQDPAWRSKYMSFLPTWAKSYSRLISMGFVSTQWPSSQ